MEKKKIKKSEANNIGKAVIIGTAVLIAGLIAFISYLTVYKASDYIKDIQQAWGVTLPDGMNLKYHKQITLTGDNSYSLRYGVGKYSDKAKFEAAVSLDDSDKYTVEEMLTEYIEELAVKGDYKIDFTKSYRISVRSMPTGAAIYILWFQDSGTVYVLERGISKQ